MSPPTFYTFNHLRHTHLMQGRAKWEGRDNIGPWPPLLRRLPLPNPHLLRHLLLKHHSHLLQASPLTSGLFKHNYFLSETTASSSITRTGIRKLVFALRNKITLVTTRPETSALTTDSRQRKFAQASFGGKLNSHQLDVRVRTWSIGRAGVQWGALHSG